MSIVVRGMEMPKNCWHCPLQYDYLYCSVRHCIKITEKNEDKRDKKCPLFELKSWKDL